MSRWCCFSKPKKDSFTEVSYGIHCPHPLRQRMGLQHFKLLRAIGHGCASTIFEVVHIPSGTRCVLKVCLKTRLYVNEEKRIRREIHIHSIMNHRHILQFYACFEDATAFYMVLEYAQHGDLLKYIRMNYHGRMPFSSFRSLILQPLVESIFYLHQNHIIHRDIKPENILVDGQCRIRLCDFGFSINSYEERPKSRLGTIEYMAPELLNTVDAAYTEKVDIWAIGVLTYECLVGVSPFYDKDENKIIDNILQGRYVSPQYVPTEIQDLINITLQCDPKKRPTIQELIRHPVMTMEVPRKSVSY